eukprot:CAMPEP_0203907068 /NCGR_PEP_ID=MMETSP0359-20131031/48605_1 /ASSEMBLY_ACC=CAM_ASM_000338 /TAXON_ID=268821 /ORGANISM="Scrippsiella Hangoei, Strain SHTV-5" /LENGTH=963 /DNA_ID=CAMNT_0050831827 /DNA_START=197 /DNA_END=3084 /DNA_ORIENTATION=+
MAAAAESRGRRLLISSLHPISHSGYGQQTQILVGELQARGWEISLLSWNLRHRGDFAEDLRRLMRKHGVSEAEMLRQAGSDPRVLLDGVPVVTARLAPPEGHAEGLGWLEILRAVELTEPDVVLHLHDAWWLGPPPSAALAAAASGRLPPRVAWLPVLFDPLVSDDPTRPDRSGASLAFFTGVVAMSLWGRGVYEAALADIAERALAEVAGKGRPAVAGPGTSGSDDGSAQATAQWLPPLLGWVPHALHSAFSEGPLGSSLAERLRSALGLPEEAFVVLLVGRNPPPPSTEAARKSHRAAIRAFARFRSSLAEICSADKAPEGCGNGRSTAHLHIHCEIDGGVDIRALLQEAGLPPVGSLAVTTTKEFLPPEQLRGLYSSADVLLQLSRAEGFGLPVVEAQACGTPVIANGATAMAENVLLGRVLPLAGKPSGGRDDRLGSWTPPDIQAAASALMEVWRSPPGTAERNLARTSLVANLAPERVGGLLDRHLRSVLPQRPAPPPSPQHSPGAAASAEGLHGEALPLPQTPVAEDTVARRAQQRALGVEDEDDILEIEMEGAQDWEEALLLDSEAEVDDAAMLAGDLEEHQSSGSLQEFEGSRPICPKEYKDYVQVCTQQNVEEPPLCSSLQDSLRSCLRSSSSRQASEVVNRLVSTRSGSPMLYNVFDLYVGRSLEEYGEWLALESSVHAALLEGRKAGSVVIEVGANIGALTVPLGKMVGRGGRVISTEADRFNAQLLAANVALAQLLNVETLQVVVGATSGVAEVMDEAASRTAFTDFRSTRRSRPAAAATTAGVGEVGGFVAPGLRSAQRVTVDQLAAGFSRLDLLKIGHVSEAPGAVLRGARQTLQRLGPWLLVEVPRLVELEDIQNSLQRLGYDCMRCDVALFNADNWRGARSDIFVPAGSHVQGIVCGRRSDMSSGASAPAPAAWRSARVACEAAMSTWAVTAAAAQTAAAAAAAAAG